MKLLSAYVCTVLIAMLALLFWPRDPVKADQQATEASPGLVWRSGTYTMFLLDQDCPYDQVKGILEMEGVPPAKAYRTAQLERIDVPGCWVKTMDGDVLTMLGTGNSESSLIPLNWFTKPGAN